MLLLEAMLKVFTNVSYKIGSARQTDHAKIPLFLLYMFISRV